MRLEPLWWWRNEENMNQKHYTIFQLLEYGCIYTGIYFSSRSFSTDLSGGEASIGVLLLGYPFHNTWGYRQVFWGWGRLGGKIGKEQVRCHLHFSRRSPGLVIECLSFLKFPRTLQVDWVFFEMEKDIILSLENGFKI